MRVQVVIVGGGPAGHLLGQLLHQAGIDALLLEQRSQAYVLSRIRAGVLEQVTCDVMDQLGIGQRMHAQGLVHGGFSLGFDGRTHRIDMAELTGGQHVMVYGQTEVTQDLMDARAAAGLKTIYEAEQVSLHDFDGTQPRVRYMKDGVQHEVHCDFIAGCDGYHGVSRASVPAAAIQTFERIYPFGWLGALADTPPVAHELVYSAHPRGFSLCSMRSPTRSRYYLQCPLTDQVAQWSDDDFWAELRRRIAPELAETLVTGPTIEKSIAPLRSFVAEPMRFGRLFLAGDAAHIVPPTGAKGLNLAASDVQYLARAISEFYASSGPGKDSGLNHYSDACLRRVWKAVRFSWWFTSVTHQFSEGASFEQRVQMAELDYLVGSNAASTALAQNYVGLPMEDW